MRKVLYTAAAAAAALGLGFAVPAFASSPAHTTTIHAASSVTTAQPDYIKADCATAPEPGGAHCDLLINKLVKAVKADALKPDAAPGGLGPSDYQSAYNLPSATNGKGQTVALVEAGDDATLESDLAVYRSQYGLPPCTTANGCFKKLNEQGQASPLPPINNGWADESTLDVEMVSAVCPLCNIDVIETATSLDGAQDGAVAAGAHYISNSWSSSETSGENATDQSEYNHPGVVDVASAGDAGFGISWPSAARDVVSVGGTELDKTSSGSWDETAWEFSGGGCSRYETKQTFQTTTDCGTMRTANDVSAVAGSNQGIAEYNTQDGGWIDVGGTSVSAPIIAAVYALAGNPPTTEPTASTLYANPQDLNDITSGSNGSCSPSNLCNAGPGYDGPTGMGTPDGIGAFGGSGGGGGGGTGGGNPPSGSTIKGNHSGLCLSVTGNSSTLKSTADIDNCTSASTEMWTVNSSGTIVNGNGLCLSVSGGSTALKTTADVYTCNSSASEFWTVSTSGTITNSNSKLCLSVTGASTTAGATADMYTCNGSVSENWTVG